jgi:ribonuclease BN (tRNA processing enzyme)
MTESLKQAYAADIKIRSEGLEGLSRQALNINVHEITAGGQIYRDANISVQALAMSRGSGIEALGYSVKAGGRNIVIAGNSVPRPALTEACDRCDLLLYEVFTAEGSNAVPGPDTDDYQRRLRQSMEELAEVAAKTRPKLLVLYHQLYLGSRAGVDLEEEIHRTYPGKVVLGRDLAAY